MLQYAGSIPFSVREETDLSWLKQYGQVERVWDGLTSGNLVFQVNGPYGRMKVKYAGARPLNYTGRPDEAADRLRSAVQKYLFRHRAIPDLLSCGDVDDGRGFAAIFRWIEGESLHPYPPSGKNWEALRRQPVLTQLTMMDDLIDLHCMLAAHGIVAGNFQDSNLIFDPVRGTLRLCSIDGYPHIPYVNNGGRLHGSPRLMAPEEYLYGSAIDERTTVYNLGMLAFMIFGSREEMTPQTWRAGMGLYRIAERCVQENPDARWPSLQALQSVWRAQVGREML